MQTSHQACDRGRRIRHRSTKNPRVQIPLRPAQHHLTAHDSTQAIAQRRHTGRHHAGIGNRNHIAAQFLTMLPQKFRKVRAADFFFTFKQENQIHRQITLLAQRLLDTQHMGHHLPFVVSCATCKDFPITKDRLKRLSRPQLQGIHWLHIVVTINQHRAPTLKMRVLCKHDRMPGRLVQCRDQADAGKFRTQPFGTGTYITRMPRVGRHTGKSEKRKEILKLRVHGADARRSSPAPQGESGGKSRIVRPL